MRSPTPAFTRKQARHLEHLSLKVLVAATADVNEGCTGKIIATVGKDNCAVDVVAVDDSIVDDADTKIIVELFAEACGAGDDVIDNVDTAAKVCALAYRAWP